MLKVILLLDCNKCGLAMETALVSSLHYAEDWQSAGYTLMDELDRLAVSENWDYRFGRMVCGCCRPDQPDDEED